MFRVLGFLTGIVALLFLLGFAAVLWVFWEYGRDLPDFQQLADYEPPVTTRVHAGDGRLLAEYATERRVFVPIEAIPKHVVEAFVAAEDQRFYSHPGIDPVGIVRAVITNLRNIGTSRRPVGASTITQQVAQNFLLSKELSLERKIREAILALRMERAYSKDRILELYLNEIFLGFGSYGVAAAAINYFDKSLNELTVAEAAFLAGLPKAPNRYNPVTRPDAARARRNYVLGRMRIEGMIDAATERRAASTEIRVVRPERIERVEAAFFTEEVRRQLVDRYGQTGLYEGGLSVRTTLNPRLQHIADEALRDGLVAYDRRHGWRGPLGRLDDLTGWRVKLASFSAPPLRGNWRLAVVLATDRGAAHIGLARGLEGTLPLAELRWARPWLEDQLLGPEVHRTTDVLAVGDVVLVEAVEKDKDGKPYPAGTYGLRQIPDVQGAILALDPHTGRVLAMSGGFDFAFTQFNRATQAWRQPGSAFKPFVYLAGLDAGYTPSTLILDAPFVLDQGPGLGKWKPANYTRNFYGPSPMRLGLEKSRNLMTVRLAQTLGIDAVATYAERLGVVEHMPRQLSMAIGAGETTLMRLTTAYAMIVNGGRRIEPTLIDRIQDRNGKTILRHDTRSCDGCASDAWTPRRPPRIPDVRERIMNAGTAYQMVSMLEGVVDRGTGRRISAVGKPLAGKTGTTDESFDTWFIGFTPDLALGVYVGFDEPRTLGRGETGSTVAAPIFQQFMKGALDGRPGIPFRIPAGIRLVRVDAETGLVAGPDSKNVILEAFKPGTEPHTAGAVIDGGYDPLQAGGTAPRGIY
ncbi:MAG: penicillin-binding protein 1A [Alphaproteobacteria bacterium]